MNQQLIKINGEYIDIDDRTAIGIDFVSYDIKEPSVRYSSVSNSFSIPKTKNNLNILGFAGIPQSLYDTVYSKLEFDYYVGNEQIIRNGIASITEIGDRIKMFASSREDIWAQFKNESWIQFQADFINWMQVNKGLPSISNTYTGSFTDFIEQYRNSTEGLYLPYFVSNLYLEGSETVGAVQLQKESSVNSLGGHWCVYLNTIFEFIEDFYEVDFSITDTFDYNIFNDAIASLMYTPLRNLYVYHVSATEFYFEFKDDIPFLPEAGLSIDKEDKTLYDFVKVYLQTFNILVDRELKSDGSTKFKLRRFDDILNADVELWDSGFTGKQTFKPSIENWNQNNYIKYSAIYEGGNSLINSKYIECKNKNIDVGKTEDSLFDIDAYIPAQLAAGGGSVPDLSVADSFNEFTFFISGGDFSSTVRCESNGFNLSTVKLLKIAQLYSLDSEYTTVESMLEYPVYYSAERWVNLQNVLDLEYFKLYLIPELGGYYFLNKISGYNPSKSARPTKIELIKVR